MIKLADLISETIKKVDDKWVVYPKKGGKRLGTHDTKEKALKQLAAIEINKENVNEVGDASAAAYKWKPVGRGTYSNEFTEPKRNLFEISSNAFFNDSRVLLEAS